MANLNKQEIVRLSLQELRDSWLGVDDMDLAWLDGTLCSLVDSIIRFWKIHLPNMTLPETVEAVTSEVMEKYQDILSFNSIQFTETEDFWAKDTVVGIDDQKLAQAEKTRWALTELLLEINHNLNISDDKIFRNTLIVFQRANNLSDEQMAGQFKVSNGTYQRWIAWMWAPRRDERKKEIFQILREYPNNWLV